MLNLKCESPRRKHKRKSLLSWVREIFLSYDTKSIIPKSKKMIHYIKVKNFCSLKYTVKRSKDRDQYKILHIIHLIKELYSEYIYL